MKNIKQLFQHWTYDTKGKYNDYIPVIEKIIVLLQEIINIWEQDINYRNYSQQLSLLLYKYSDNALINNIMKYCQNIKMEEIKNNREFILRVIAQCALEYNYSLEDVINSNECINAITSYIELLKLKYSYKLHLFIENYALIYHNCLIINAFRKKHSEIFEIIGRYENIDDILGNNGVLLKNENKNAIAYVENLKKILESLEIEYSKIMLDYQTLKSIK